MDKKVQQALKAALAGYKIGQSGSIPATFSADDQSVSFYNTLVKIFSEGEDFNQKMKAMDEAFDDEPAFEPLREFFFDLLLINFFQSDATRLDDDYLESPEWLKIEDDTIDRGTELLNLFLYLHECDMENIGPELSDYLKEFLLIEEEEFQEELEIYEDVVAHQMLVESTYAEIAKTTEKLDETAPLKDLFYVLMSFFNETEPEIDDLEDYLKNASNKSFDTAALFAILVYNYSLSELPVKIN
ncbi:hypothetical protein C3K47_04815 [Solitalea longa]|uniref:Uncharacterized protein n=1 Tax=Solitalea longa TaxID=2079460 RepID=A0A2S5A5Q4_9SPHI|nr:hypothetical protein [Solitalea longa]POY37856.1 hypothetical protein C3K47_04815 [Solitalea longa]